MKKRSFTLLMTALTVSATLLGTSPILAETKDDTATEETADKDAADTEETDAKDEESKDADTDGRPWIHKRFHRYCRR